MPNGLGRPVALVKGYAIVQKWRRADAVVTGEESGEENLTNMTCSIQGCANEAAVRGLCRMHYMRARRTGDATRTRRRGPKPKPFVDPELDRTEGQVITELRRQLAQAKSRVAELRRRLAETEVQIKRLQEPKPSA